MVKEYCRLSRTLGQAALGQIFRQPGDGHIYGDSLVAMERAGEFASQTFRAETEHFFLAQMAHRRRAVFQFENAASVLFASLYAGLALASAALGHVNMYSRGFFFDFQELTLPSETSSQHCIPCSEQADGRR